MWYFNWRLEEDVLTRDVLDALSARCSQIGKMRKRTWCSSAKRENLNRVTHFRIHFVVKTTRILVSRVSLISLLICNESNSIMNTKSRFAPSTGTARHQESLNNLLSRSCGSS